MIPQHFILATKPFKPQTDLLEQDDLDITMACLKAWEEGTTRDSPKRLYAFFNSGQHSGASQPHRHLQFLPVEEMDHGEGWKLLTDAVAQSPSRDSALCENAQLPFLHYGARLQPDTSAEELRSTYLRLYRKAQEAVESFRLAGGHVEPEKSGQDGASISYNLALTTSLMVICPRRSEGSSLWTGLGAKGDNGNVGIIALNGTILAGTLMVKAEDEWHELRNHPEQLEDLLRATCIPRPALSQGGLSKKL